MDVPELYRTGEIAPVSREEAEQIELLHACVPCHALKLAAFRKRSPTGQTGWLRLL